jgi:hypothetical protein
MQPVPIHFAEPEVMSGLRNTEQYVQSFKANGGFFAGESLETCARIKLASGAPQFASNSRA